MKIMSDNMDEIQIDDWRLRRVKTGRIRADQLCPHPDNPKYHPWKQRRYTAGSINSLGQLAPVTINLSNGYLVDGHDRAWLALQHGDETLVEVDYVELTEDEHLLAMQILDETGQYFEYDREKTEGLLKQLQETDSALQTILQGDERLNAMLSDMAEREGIQFCDEPDVPEDPGAQIDRAAELQEQWQVLPGDLWIIPSMTGDGQHRLLCGDSTNADDVARVMGDEKADAVVTDPPYGINHDTNYKRFSGGISQSRNFGSPIANDGKPFDPSHLLDFESVILWGANCYPQYLSIGAFLIWDKRDNGREKLLSDGEVGWFNHGYGTYIFNHTWNGFVRDSERGETLHPTQKPVELFKWCLGFIKSSIIYDPYGGSGPIMVACEQLQRQCRMIEILPKYCAVILQRMTDMGLTPERVD